MLRWGCTLLFTAICFSSSLWAQDKFIVLVPGFFNFPGDSSQTLGLHYFSKAILETVREQGYTPIMIENLDPVGSVAENGARLRVDLQQLTTQHPHASFAAIGHSAGGLYLAWALDAQPNLPLDQVVTIATPYHGVDMIELLKVIPGWRTLTAALNLKSLQEFENERMNGIFTRLRLPPHTRWIALAAAQPTCLLWSCADAANQSWLLSLAWTFNHNAGDGVVSVQSALGQNFTWIATDGQRKPLENWADFVIPLEHWEIALESRMFPLLGVQNPRWIEQQQRQVFTQILHRLN